MAKKIFFLVLIGSFIFSSLIFSTQAEDNPPQAIRSLSFDLESKMVNGLVQKSHFKIKDQAFRCEVENQGEEIVTIYDPKEGSYMYYPKKHTAIKLPTTQASQPPQEIKENFAENPNFSKIGEETLNGQLCDIYESNEAKFWVRRDINFPVKVVYQPGNSSGMSEVEYKNVAVNPKLDDKLFRLPEGTAVSDFAEKLNEQIQKLGDLDVEEVFKKYGQ